ncbi:Protein cornichon homolog 4 [Linum perenne]
MSGWVFIFLLLLTVIWIVGFQLMCLSDLEFDYVNPYDSARRINSLILPEFIAQGALCLSFLFSGHWVLCLVSLPCLYFNLTLYMEKKHLVDVTEIYNCNRLHREKNQRFCKMGHLFLLVVFSLFWLLWTVMEEEMD